MPVIPGPKPTSIEMPDKSEPDETTKALAQLKKMQERQRLPRAGLRQLAWHPKSPKAKTPNPKAKSNQLKGKSKPGNK